MRVTLTVSILLLLFLLLIIPEALAESLETRRTTLFSFDTPHREEPERTAALELVQQADRGSNIAKHVRPGNEPILLVGDPKIGIVLIHGFSASPHEVESLAYYLHRELNATVYAPRLPGHGTSPSDFAHTTSDQWYAGAESAFLVMNSTSDHVYVIGVSLGGNLALDIAKHHDLAQVVSISAPVSFLDNKISYAPYLKYFINTIPNNRLSEDQKDYYYYNRSVAAIAELYDYVEAFPHDLSRVEEPALILQSSNDFTIDFHSGDAIYEGISSQNKHIIPYESFSHTLINDREQNKIFLDIIDSIKLREQELVVE